MISTYTKKIKNININKKVFYNYYNLIIVLPFINVHDKTCGIRQQHPTKKAILQEKT